MADYRHPRNDQTIDVVLRMIRTQTRAVVETLGLLVAYLDDDVELTPQQSETLSETLAGIGRAGAAILLEDLRRTNAREDRPTH